jgi:hypothetical protein
MPKKQQITIARLEPTSREAKPTFKRLRVLARMGYSSDGLIIAQDDTARVEPGGQAQYVEAEVTYKGGKLFLVTTQYPPVQLDCFVPSEE